MKRKQIARFSLLVGMIGLVVCILFFSVPQVRNTFFQPQAVGGPYLFGTLETANSPVFTELGLDYAAVAQREHAAGIGVAQITLAWKDYEPADGVFDEGMMAALAQHITSFLQAGQRVDVQLAVHYVPSWVMNISDAYYMNQYGVAAPQSYGYDDPNYVFNATVRQKLQDFETHALQQLDAQVGLNKIWDFRLDDGDGGEANYGPATDAYGHTNSYWAFDANAQGMGNNLPAGVGRTPFPGWVPGQRDYQGQPFTIAQVQRWYEWYVASRVNYYNWQIALYRRAGFSQYLTIETPGFGTRPDEYTANMQRYLDGSRDPNGTMSRAAVWQKVYLALTHQGKIIAYISSMADAGSPSPNDLCRASDAQVDFATDPVVDTWGAVRYVSAIANMYGFLKGGENPGYGAGAGAAYGVGMLQRAAKEMASCGLIGMFWAHDERLYTTAGTPSANIITLADYARIIGHYNSLRA